MKFGISQIFGLTFVSLALASSAQAIPTAGSNPAQGPSLAEASKAGNLAEVRKLLQDKSNPNQRSVWGYTALEYALQADSELTGLSDSNRKEIVRALISAGAHVTLPALTHAQRLDSEFASLLKGSLNAQIARCEGSKQAKDYAERYAKLSKATDKSFEDISLMTDLQWKIEDVGCAVLLQPAAPAEVANAS